LTIEPPRIPSIDHFSNELPRASSLIAPAVLWGENCLCHHSILTAYPKHPMDFILFLALLAVALTVGTFFGLSKKRSATTKLLGVLCLLALIWTLFLLWIFVTLRNSDSMFV